ncbi:unnamed protein product, partial [Gongylonema pulchrum]|uniref:Transmembrane protein 209 n=1 Tax=Gongylonema pulchrum TaxID=637853 RepID=A0A183EC75_9BILA
MLSQKGEAAVEQEDSVDNLATSTVATSEGIDFDYTPSGQTKEEEWPLLWRLLKVKTDVKEMDMPVMEMISAKKLQKILSLCIRPTSANVQQCDIEHLNWLLHRESIVVANEMQPEFCSVISKESKQLLRYCVNYNLSKNAEASMRQLVSGWLSFVNVFAIFAPVPLVPHVVQYQYISDAVYLLLSYASGIVMDMKLSAAVSQCLL